MFRVRPVKLHDFDALCALAHAAEIGMTSLRSDETKLKILLEQACLSFSNSKTQGKNGYFAWILEDVSTGQAIGCAAVKASVGGAEPFYSIKRQHQRVYSEHTNITRDDEWLLSHAHFPLSTELASLFIHPDFRHHQLGVLLSYARLLFIANFPNYFNNLIIAEVRGVSDEKGFAPFWEGLGRHFFHMTFSQADERCWLEGNDFIKELMPTVPILAAMLPMAAQEVMGQAHNHSKSALALLKKQGFTLSPHVDMFDGGPLIWSELSHISVIKTASRVKAHIGELKLSQPGWLIRDTHIQGMTVYAAGELMHQISGDKFMLGKATAELLQIKEGDELMIYSVGELHD